MGKTITLREADEAFSRVIREVEAGAEFTITRDGEPVARLVPVRPMPTQGERVLTPEQEAALERTRRRMEKGWPLNTGRFNRDEIYDERIERYNPKRRG